MIEVKAIAPYPGLRDLILHIAKEQKNIKIDVEIGDLKDGVEIAEKAFRQGYDMIISRGGTASLIRRHVSIPVIEVSVSGYDILRSLTLIKEYKGKIGIIGFRNIVEGATAVCTLLDMDIARYIIEDENKVENVLKQAIEEGVEVVLGDVITIETAQRLGLHGILITSGEESVNEAFDSVYKVYEMLEKKKEEGKLFEQLLNQDDRGILLVDQNQQIRFANENSRKMFPTANLQNLTLNALEQIIPTSIIMQKKAEQILGESMMIYYLTQYEDIKNMLYRFNQSKLPQISEPLANFGQFIKISEEMQELIIRAKNYAILKNTIWIVGEQGTGKRMLAEAIHNESFFNHGPFAAISFYQQSLEEIEEQLFGTNLFPGYFELTQGGTLLIEGIESGTTAIYKKIVSYLNQFADLRLIFTSSISINDFIQQDKLSASFYHQMEPFVLVLPSLRDRLEDMSDLIRLFLAKLNTKYGKQIVGVKEDVLEELKSYPWNGNVDELQKVIEEVVIQTSGYFIEKKNIEFLKNRYKIIEKTNNRIDNDHLKNKIVLSLDKTLDELEQEIILAVLTEEQMNQSKTAKRLGINRTTLWRKIRLQENG